eukprot:15461140-Alexandrium_andersonii.AAC.1
MDPGNLSETLCCEAATIGSVRCNNWESNWERNVSETLRCVRLGPDPNSRQQAAWETEFRKAELG